ncbi:hypothetical protein L7F22_036091 [Adiantum nelumboides]|nr:hypothetical protein [Adiantum nelumboides]
MEGRVQESEAAAAERSSCTCTAGCRPDHVRNGDYSSCEMMLMIGGDHDDIMQEALPPGFRFHPTEEELVGFYLRRRAAGLRLPARVIPDVDLYKHEPWELPGLSSLPSSPSYAQWFFFNFTDRKYPSGPRANRATLSGYWKATGRDRSIPTSRHSSHRTPPSQNLCGIKKTLVFYFGRAPHGKRTPWVMHEFRLSPVHCPSPSSPAPSQCIPAEIVLCRIVKKVPQVSMDDCSIDRNHKKALLL